MNKISAIIITKNAEDLIADCLDSVSDLADEIIVVDSGSEDRTLDIAERMEAKVFVHKTSDFSELRNYGLRKAEGDWVLYVDVDERITDELRSNIQFQISNFKYPMPTVYKLRRRNFYLGNHEWPYVEKLERLFKRDSIIKWQGVLHETPAIKGKIGELEGFLLHYTHRDLTSMLAKTIEWSKTEAQLRFNSNHPKMTWWRFPRVMISAFFDSYIKQQGWKAGTAGLIESIYQSFSIFITYARLWELQNSRKIK